MQICIAGWYFDPELLNLMKKVNEKHTVCIIAHKEGDGFGLPVIKIPNIGLEFGCYSYFLKNIWNESSDVLFMHDDLKVAPILVNYEIIPATNIFNKIAKVDVDQAYVFQDEEDAKWNAYKHGRMIFTSGKLLKYLRENGGIWFDEKNTGYTTTGPYNAGIVSFHETMAKLYGQFNTCNLIFAPAITMLRRNGNLSKTSEAVAGGQ